MISHSSIRNAFSFRKTITKIGSVFLSQTTGHDVYYWKKFVSCIRNDDVTENTVTVELKDLDLLNDVPTVTNFHFTSLLLPNKIPWPTFRNNKKQEGAFAKDMYLRRDSLCDRMRREMTLKWLQKGLNVALLGNPGVGKSSDNNDIIRTVLNNLGEGGWWKTLVYKNGIKEYITFNANEGGTVSTELFKWVSRSSFEEALSKFEPGSIVLINELHESENDADTSCFPIGMPMLLSLSTRDAGKVMKTLRKGMKLREYYVDLLPEEVCAAMVRAMVNHEPLTSLEQILEENCEGDMEDFSGTTEEVRTANVRAALLTIYQKRQEEVGPILRSILSRAAYGETTDFLTDEQHIPALISALSSWNIRNNPAEVRHFAAARLRPEVTHPDIDSKPPIYSLQFHSEHIRCVVQQNIQHQAQVNRLNSNLYEFALLESYAQDSQHSDSAEMETWAWYSDPGPSVKITSTLRLEGSKVPVLPRWTLKGRVPNVVLRHDVVHLSEERIYIPVLHTHRLYDHMTIRKPKYNDEGVIVEMGVVYLVQCTGLDFKDHPFAESTLQQVLQGLNLGKEEGGRGKHYMVMLVCMKDQSTPPGHGASIRVPVEPTPVNKKSTTPARPISSSIAAVAGQEETKTIKFKKMSVAEWAQTEQAQRFAKVTSIMVRVPAFPRVPEIVVSAPLLSN